MSKSLQQTTNYPIKTDTVQTSESQWELLTSYINMSSFLKIPKKVGSPDAPDRGSEWIEIKSAGKIHKVIYDETGPEEYEGIKNLAKLLKQITGF